jgi:hypothetical protein
VAETFLAVKSSGDDGNEMQERVMTLLAMYHFLRGLASEGVCTCQSRATREAQERKALKNDSRQKTLV